MAASETNHRSPSPIRITDKLTLLGVILVGKYLDLRLALFMRFEMNVILDCWLLPMALGWINLFCLVWMGGMDGWSGPRLLRLFSSIPNLFTIPNMI